MSTDPLVSIIIPTRNAGHGFGSILHALRQQSIQEVEIVIVDSGSTDSTPVLGEQYGAKVISIAPEEFNHGGTRNLGIRQSRGSLIACLVQDAKPASSNWLRALVEAIQSDPRVAGAYSRQLPWPGDDALTQFLVHGWHQVQGGQRVVQKLAPETGLQVLPYAERHRICGFNNVSSMLRREVWERMPLRPVQFAEDMDWAKRVLLQGFYIIYEPASEVYHSHTRPFFYNLKRQYVDERVLMDLLEADEATIRTWNGLKHSLALVCGVLARARAERSLSLRLIWHTLSFAQAVMLGSLARRLIHPKLRAECQPAWAQRADARLMAGI